MLLSMVRDELIRVSLALKLRLNRAVPHRGGSPRNSRQITRLGTKGRQKSTPSSGSRGNHMGPPTLLHGRASLTLSSKGNDFGGTFLMSWL